MFWLYKSNILTLFRLYDEYIGIRYEETIYWLKSIYILVYTDSKSNMLV